MGGLASYFIFPISRTLLLKGRRTKVPGKYYEQIAEAETNHFNREIIRNCDQEVYASVKNAEIAQIVDDCAGDARSIKHKINVK